MRRYDGVQGAVGIGNNEDGELEVVDENETFDKKSMASSAM